MASSSISILLFACFLVVLWHASRVYANNNGCYSSIISFGDSISDTGNKKQLAYLYPDVVVDKCGPPNGQDFFGEATGRCSNGRLIVDFLAESLGFPLLPPYVNYNESQGLVTGVNFATSGATVLDSSLLTDIWNGSFVFDATLGVQLSWLKQSLPSICGNNTNSDCKDFIGRSLIIMGGLGSNDYNVLLQAGKVIDEVKTYVPLVTDTMILAVNELIEMGARTIVVPGNFPFGCFPAVLVLYASDGDEYDPITGCLVNFNDFSEYHNKMLQAKLDQTRELNPNINIIYADYYNAALQIYLSLDEYGFTNGVSNTCCGGGGPFNFNATLKCGDAFTTICDDPDTYAIWDGIHYTEAAYKVITKNLFQGPYTTPKFSSLCPTKSTTQAGVRLSSSV
ncbi:hypothetical protein SSX86_027927 [Deinandra increscens subsp. villosa]|uniref:Uncharacterized protein n=1 Tax=Deinandra increscens subsp. villosa TaxID=3103831 RepID=A0AAP0GKU1_9ASTR